MTISISFSRPPLTRRTTLLKEREREKASWLVLIKVREVHHKERTVEGEEQEEELLPHMTS